MQQHLQGSFKLFRLAGVDVHLHWSWFIVAFLQIGMRHDFYGNPAWKVVEYLSLFAIVLAHEFGHALACRSVGGEARDIILWPLGGIAYVQPPMQPGPVLWSIAAGPLVNLVLIIPFGALVLWFPAEIWPDLALYFQMMLGANIVLFVFNMLPVYPLDGGQILHAILWFWMGRWASLQAAAAMGMILGTLMFFGSLLLLPIALKAGGASAGSPLILSVLALFITLHSAASYQLAKHALYIENLPRHADCACPMCHSGPPHGPFWRCDECGAYFDKFDCRGKCPECGMWHLQDRCIACGHETHVDRWFEYRPGEGLVARQPEEDESKVV